MMFGDRATATWAACLTPPGASAIAVLAVRGPEAWSILKSLFRPYSKSKDVLSVCSGSPSPSGRGVGVREKPCNIPSPSPPTPLPEGEGRLREQTLPEGERRLREQTLPEGEGRLREQILPEGEQTFISPEVGRIYLGYLGTDIADEVVLAVRQVEPVPWIEIHCHGGREVVRLLLEILAERGIQVVTWQEFEQQQAATFWQAAALEALAAAPTIRTAAILLDQYHGALDRALQAVQTALACGNTTESQLQLAELARYSHLGRHLTTPWKVVIAGAPNVGKSSLVNALAGYQRSIVAPTPGTTRDVVVLHLAIDGWPVEIADTAGLRDEAEPLEALGMERARSTADAADLCLWILDGSVAPVWPAKISASWHPIIHKVDLSAAWDWEQVPEAVRVSSLTGAGLEDLCKALSAWLVPEIPPAGVAVPFTDSLCDMIEKAHQLSLSGQQDALRAMLRSSFSSF